MSMIKNYKSTMIEYKTWYSMIKRCSDKNRLDYKNYGGRGIKVCDKWVSSFDLFFKDFNHALYSIETNSFIFTNLFVLLKDFNICVHKI